MSQNGLVFILFLILSSSSAWAQVRLQYATQIEQSQRDLLNEDLRTLPFLNLRDSEDNEFRKFFEIPENESLSHGLENWLAQRAHYVVSESFELTPAVLRARQKNVRYPEADLFPEFIRPLAKSMARSFLLGSQKNSPTKEPPAKSTAKLEVSQSARGGTVMANVGGLAYGLGKALKTRLEMKLDGLGWIPVQTGQVGVFKVGERLFQNIFSTKKDPADFVYRLRRIETLVHESRHGDGHGKSLLFPHAKCPQDSDYPGQFACDVSGNGAYRAGALVLKAAFRACENCDAQDIEILKVLLADRMSRTISDEILDPKPEGIKP